MKKDDAFSQRMRKAKRSAAKTAERVKHGLRAGTNINTYNKWLFIFETVLFVGVLDEFLEGKLLDLDLGLYVNVAILMLMTGTLFTFAFRFIERYTQKTISWLVRLNSNKILRLFVHLVIISLLFYLYAKVFFEVNLSLVLDIGVSAS